MHFVFPPAVVEGGRERGRENGGTKNARSVIQEKENAKATRRNTKQKYGSISIS